MQKRDVVRMVLEGKQPPYVPWSMGFTKEARAKLQAHFGGKNTGSENRASENRASENRASENRDSEDRDSEDRDSEDRDSEDIDETIGNHLLKLGSDIGFFDDLGDDHVRDVFDVVWDRSIDKDIGNVEGCVLPRPTLDGYAFPDPLDRRFFEDIPDKIARFGDRFRVFQIGFSLYERAWTLRGMSNLLMDFLERPDFVKKLLRAIADYNIAQVREALNYEIDAVYFGDDWGQQWGLQMGPKLWRDFILPELKRMYCEVREADKFVMIHSCGDVDEVFEDLIAAGVNCFNPFQPEVMDVDELLVRYRGRLAFHGGLSTQRTMPFGSVQDVQAESRRLLERGAEGGYIFAPAHDVEGDVSLGNMLAAIEVVRQQPAYAELA